MDLKQEILNQINFAADLKDPILFKSVLSKCEGIISEKDMMKEFDVDASSYRRWRNGVSQPIPALRKSVLLFIKEHCQ